MTPRDVFEQAREGLVSHRLRAGLSSIGIVVGVGTVIASLAVGEGARRVAIAEISGLGVDNGFVRTVTPTGEAQRSPAAPELTRADASAIASTVTGVDAVAVARWARVDVASEARTVQAPLAGVSSPWADLAHVRTAEGRPLVEDDERRARQVAVVGATLARGLAPRGDLLGARLTIGGQILRVVGILESRDQRAGASSVQAFNPDESVLVPVSAMDARIGAGDSADRVSEIGVHAASGSELSRIGAAVAALMARRHAGAADRYELFIPRELLRARLRAQRTFDAVLLATGFIALVISGVGIMNVMLAAVAEREPEIGARRAFGARRVEIVQQFALEAALLCLAGGIAGIPVGAALALAVSLMAGWPVAISAGGVSMAVALATAVGLAFGIYPAYRAASVDPIIALRG